MKQNIKRVSTKVEIYTVDLEDAEVLKNLIFGDQKELVIDTEVLVASLPGLNGATRRHSNSIKGFDNIFTSTKDEKVTKFFNENCIKYIPVRVQHAYKLTRKGFLMFLFHCTGKEVRSIKQNVCEIIVSNGVPGDTEVSKALRKC